jgi:hypothetical protein
LVLMQAGVRCALLFALACGEASSPPDATAIDAGTDAGVNPTCTIDLSSAEPSTSEGGRIDVDVATDPGALYAIHAPPGWRVVDRRIEPPYGVSGRFPVTATATCADGSVGQGALDVDVRRLRFASIQWSAGDGPAEREHPLLFLDAEDPDRMFLFGGFLFEPRQFTIAADLWAFDLAAETWTAVTSSNAPMLAAGRGAPLPGEAAIAYAGGVSSTNEQPFSLARLDYRSGEWTSLTANGAPSGGTSLGSYVHDAPRARHLSICGFGDRGVHCNVDAYEYRNVRWRRLTVADGPKPTPRYGFFVANDEANERVILFSGGQASSDGSVNPAHDTWALELAESPVRWVEIEGPGPPGRRNGCSAVDPIGRRFFVFGGTPDARTTEEGLYVLDLDRGEEEWTRVEPEGAAPVRSSCSAIYDPARHRILFGFGNSSSAIYADWQALEL